MKAIVPVLLIVGSLFLGYLGVNKIQSNSASVKVLGLEIEADNQSGKEQGYIFLGLAVLLFAGGVVTYNKSRN